MRRIITASKLLKRPVMAVNLAQEVGKVTGFAIHPDTGCIDAILYGRRSGTRIVAWEILAGIGPDAVMVADDGRIKAPYTPEEESIAKGERGLIGRRVLSEIGNNLGTITDFDFDADTGEILRIVTDQATLDGDVMVRVGPVGAIATKLVDPVYVDAMNRRFTKKAPSALPAGEPVNTTKATLAEKEAIRAAFLAEQGYGSQPVQPPVGVTEVVWVDVDAIEVEP